MKLLRPITVTAVQTPVYGAGVKSPSYIMGKMVYDPVYLQEDRGDHFELGKKFDTVIDNMFLIGVTPYECDTSTSFGFEYNLPIWKCYVDAAEKVKPGTNVFSAQKTKDIRERGTGMFYCPYIPLMTTVITNTTGAVTSLTVTSPGSGYSI